ncbi:MAG TPA: ABC transporter ATP-binding protein [Candidatus Acidoferrum sp.]|nr:ABC transporter ATP-binding protein [Candidatus Acidoferrum sp.]
MDKKQRLFRMYWQATQPHSRWLYVALVLSCAGTFFDSVATPVPFSRLVEDLYRQHNLDVPSLDFVLMLGFFACGKAFSLVSNYINSRFRAAGWASLVMLVFKRMVHGGKIGNFFRLPSDTGSRLGSIDNAYLEFMVLVFRDMLGIVVRVICIVAIVGYSSLIDGGMLLGWGALSIILIVRAGQKSLPLVNSSSAAGNAVSAASIDALSNLPTIKAYAAEISEQERLDGYGARFLAANKAVAGQIFRNGLLMQSQNLVCYALQLLWTFYQVRIGMLALSSFVLIQVYSFQMATLLANVGFELQKQHERFGRAYEAVGMLDDPERTEPAVARTATPAHGGITFDHVTFSYTYGQPVIQDLSFSIRPGEWVGLTGISGEGKTTLLNLIRRFLQPQQGTVQIGGYDTADMSPETLAACIRVIFQQSELFNRSFAENIGYPCSPASPEQMAEVVSAAEAACISELIKERDGYYENPAGLSGGEQQRVRLARALMPMPEGHIILADEPTSAVDSSTEAAIIGAMRERFAGKTMLWIAHRLSSMIDFDRILVFQEGRIVEQGSPTELLAKGGRFARLWQQQTTIPGT